MSTYINLLGSNMPDDWNPTTWREMYLWFVNKTRGVIPDDLALMNYGATTPAVDDRDKPWVRTDASGHFVGVYTYGNGYWTRPHPVPENSEYRALWAGTLADLVSFERAGENPADVVGFYTGPFWEEDTEFQGRIPAGPGAIPDDTHSLTVNENYGSGMHTNTIAEMAEHNHTFGTGEIVVSAAGGSATIYNWGGGSNVFTSSSIANAGTSTPYSIIPPVRGIYVIKRTIRVYFVV